MEFLTEDFVKENELNDKQVEAFKSATENYIADQKKEWDGKANENAERIIDGAIKSTQQTFGIEVEREKGEKQADYLKRVLPEVFKKKETEIATKEQELQEKLKNFDGGKQSKEEIEKLTSELDTYKKQVAELEPLTGLDEKLNEKEQELSQLKRQVAYSKERPNFPKEVNEFEAKAKWDMFVKNFEENYVLELKDGEAWGIDKENEHKRIKLADLVKQDTNITELLQGRQQAGTGAKPKDLKDVEGVPFKVPTNADGATRSKLIREYLTGEKKLDVASKEYSEQFAELNLKIAKANAA